MKSIGLPVGISAVFWLFVGIIRLLSELKSKNKFNQLLKTHQLHKTDIAVILPAHNEELVITSCIESLKLSLDKNQIFVVSDGSTDKTVILAKRQGVHVISLFPGRGKGKAMVYLLKHFKLFERFKLIFIVDADTKIDRNFVKLALPFFDDPTISVVFGKPGIHWPKHIWPRRGLYYVAYRERLNQILTAFYTYGQTWKYTNVNYVIPGFATLYRAEILKQLEIDKEGLLIEDFNLAFQLHKKKLGKIAYKPSIIGWDQHPDSLADYWKQVRRWNIGFFQTIRANGVWPSFFWLALGIFSLEVILNSILIFFMPVLIFFWIVSMMSHLHPVFLNISSFYKSFGLFQHITWYYLTFLLSYDYLMSIVFGTISRKPQFMIYGLGFIFMHYVTSLILISSVIPGFFGSSAGKWISPKRRRE